MLEKLEESRNLNREYGLWLAFVSIGSFLVLVELLQHYPDSAITSAFVHVFGFIVNVTIMAAGLRFASIILRIDINSFASFVIIFVASLLDFVPVIGPFLSIIFAYGLLLYITQEHIVDLFIVVMLSKVLAISIAWALLNPTLGT